MTTIAATTKMMAADSRVVVDETSYLSPKLFKAEGVIVGCAGDTEACHIFIQWYVYNKEKKLVIPKGMDVEAVVLNKDGLFRYGPQGIPDQIRDGIIAVGTGGAIAMASMDTMIRLGLPPDPRIAVEVACKRNPNSSLPVDFFELEEVPVKPKRKRRNV